MAAVSLDQKRALLSVTDKTRLVELARALIGHGYELIASGGTAGLLRDHDIAVIGVGDLTGYPEIFGGRVKTLHPIVHGGILGPSREAFAETLELGIGPIDLVVVNLYQFSAAVAAGADAAATVEKIDIGGPTLLRAAAKNFQRVTVVSDPSYYDELLAELTTGNGETGLGFRRRMAAWRESTPGRVPVAATGCGRRTCVVVRRADPAWRQGSQLQQHCRPDSRREIDRRF